MSAPVTMVTSIVAGKSVRLYSVTALSLMDAVLPVETVTITTLSIVTVRSLMTHQTPV